MTEYDYSPEAYEAYLRKRDLGRVNEAFYDSKDRSTGTHACLPHTQVPGFRTIRDWVNSDSSSPLFWLCGFAGSGKSTIAYTIAQEWSHSGASFFFSRARLSLRESRFVFQTVAFQLRIDHPILRAPIFRALEDPTVLTANSETQLRKLILDPISQTQADLPKRLVIVIDALDECDDNIIADIVKVLVTTLEKYDPSVRIRLRFLVTSRPEPDLLEFFTTLHIPSFDLSAVDPADRENDIRVFLEDRLRNIATSAPDWQKEPKEEDIRLLAKISGGVFVAARIAVDYVAFGESPNSQLQKLHRARHISGLDAVYQLVLDTIVQEESARDILRPIIGTVILSFAPISRQALADLLHVEIVHLNNLLDALRAVIHVWEGDEVYPIHASLRDFLTDRDRCTDSRIFIHPTQHHTIISRACFDCMESLLQKSDLRGICRDGQKLLPGDLTYACQYWARHLAESNLDQPLVDCLHDFTSDRLLYWIEGLSLIDDLDLGIRGLGMAIKVLRSSHEVSNQVNALLSDAHWFMGHFGDMLSISAMYTYTAALQLTPANTRLHQQYASKFEGMASHLILKWDAL
jgi:hypothetical protein